MQAESLTVLLFTLWGTQHSILASNRVKKRAGFDPLDQKYRIGFIVISLLSFAFLESIINIYLIPEGKFVSSIIDMSILSDLILYYILTITGWIMAIGAFIQAGPLTFSGLKGEKRAPIKFNGFYRFSRHPIYFGVMLATLALMLTVSNSVLLVKYLSFLIYFVIGAKLEERRLTNVLEGYEEMLSRPFLFPYRKEHIRILFGRERKEKVEKNHKKMDYSIQ